MRIDIVSMPNIEGKKPEESIKLLYNHCREVAVKVMELNNTLEDLKRKVSDLEQGR